MFININGKIVKIDEGMFRLKEANEILQVSAAH